MRKYVFRLQVVLDQKKTKEDRILIELGKIRAEEVKEQKVLEKLKHQLDEAIIYLEESIADCSDTDEIQRRDYYARATEDDIQAQILTIKTIQLRVEEKRKELVQAMKERQILEALKEKQEALYIEEAQRAELKMLDEMASVRYARGIKLC